MKLPILEEFSKAASGRIADMELKQGYATATIQEMQGAVTALRMEVQQVRGDAAAGGRRPLALHAQAAALG